MAKQRIYGLFLVSILVAHAALAFSQNVDEDVIPENGPWVVRAWWRDSALVNELAAVKQPWQVDRINGWAMLDADAELYNQLIVMGFLVEVDWELTRRYHTRPAALEGQGGGIPGFPCYLTVEETFDLAQTIVQNHPTLAEWIDIGDSWEKIQNVNQGYDLMVLKLTNQTIPGPKPKFFAMSSVHAREYTPAGLTARFAEYLIDNYGQDADATWILDHHEVHLLLQANPDGRKRAETGILWRKNADNDFCANSNDRGVDLNRNYEFMWNCCGGSSGSQCSDVYRGPSPGSEPETQAVVDYVRAIFPDQRGDAISDPAPDDATGIFFDLHSFSQLVLWPYGFDNTLAPNNTALQTLGRKFGFFNGYRPEKASVSFNTDGTTDDFAYGDLGVAAYTFELGTWFFQDCSVFENTILPGNLPAMIYAAKVCRTPYLTPAGPDALNLAVDIATPPPGTPVTLTATLSDTRYNNSFGTEPVQDIAAAEYYIDTPYWDAAGSPTPIAMQAADGAFNSSVEAVTATVATAGLSIGRHTLYMRGQDANGNWGAVSAIFIEITQSLSSLYPQWPELVSIRDMIPLVTD